METFVPFALIRCPVYNLESSYKFPAITDTFFEAGLLLASPSFYYKYIEEKKVGRLSEKSISTLWKYWIRSCFRPTPFGLFAGMMKVAISDKTSIRLAPRSEHKQVMRMDMKCLEVLLKKKTSEDIIGANTALFPNSTLRDASQNYRFETVHHNERDSPDFILSSVEKSGLLEYVLEIVAGGISTASLVKEIELSTGSDETTARQFLVQLLEEQILQSDLQPPITGDQPIDFLIQRLKSEDVFDDFRMLLGQIKKLLNEQHFSVLLYESLKEKIQHYLGSTILPRHLIQTDLFPAAEEASIDEEVIQSIVAQCEELKTLSRKTVPQKLSRFRTLFQTRYEGAVVKLVDALDPEIGIGYGNSTGEITDSEWVSIMQTKNSIDSKVLFDQEQKFVLAKYHQFLRDDIETIEVLWEELEKFQQPETSADFPSSMCLLGTLHKNGQHLTKDNYQFEVKRYGGPSVAHYFGRFLYADTQLQKLTRDIFQYEQDQNPDAIFAEIVHLPSVRSANVILRPVLRDYEIPCLGRSGAPTDRQIQLDDLYIKWENEEIILISKTLKKRIFPRLASAHNFSRNTLPMYEFLCDLQFQNILLPVVWNWGILEHEDFLPRVTYKNLVLKNASWLLKVSDVGDQQKDPAAVKASILNWRMRRKIPRYVSYSEMEADILIDLENEFGIKLLVDLVRKKGEVRLEEDLNSPKSCVVVDENGRAVVSELILPLVSKPRAARNSLQLFEASKSQRAFIGDSEWLYIKIYCSFKTAEAILKEELYSFLISITDTGLCQKWFFLRYFDDSNHLRLRFLNSNKTQLGILETHLYEALQKNINANLISRITSDSYIREIERYHDCIEESETIFFNDSVFVLETLHLLDEYVNEDTRIQIALAAVNSFLDDFSMNLNEKHTLTSNIYRHLLSEIENQETVRKFLNEKFKKNQNSFLKFADLQSGTNEMELEVLKCLKKRSVSNILPINQIKGRIGNDGGKITSSLASNYIHMFVNRFFSTKQRSYEFAIALLLERCYYVMLRRNDRT